MKHILLSSACTLLTGLGFSLLISPGEALAQDDQSSAGYSLEEVTVTARRRTESLRDVPGTVTALTSDVLEGAGVRRAEGFIALTPGVTMVNAAEVGDTQVNIRGINGARDAENSFALLVDGILYTNPAAFNREYSNLKQIEIYLDVTEADRTGHPHAGFPSSPPHGPEPCGSTVSQREPRASGPPRGNHCA